MHTTNINQNSSLRNSHGSSKAITLRWGGGNCVGKNIAAGDDGTGCPGIENGRRLAQLVERYVRSLNLHCPRLMFVLQNGYHNF